jgi:carbohydrate kinase (thermoresistant glucokinase family)
MRSGTPLSDEDRGPWLAAIAQWIDASRTAGTPGVVTCSALKRRYRKILVGSRPDVALVHLKGSYDLIAQRMGARPHHYMPVSLLRSQFDALEEPAPDENAIVMTIDDDPEKIVAAIVERLNLSASRIS